MLHTKTKANYNANNANQAASGGKGRSSQKKGASQYQRRNYDFLHLPSITVAAFRGCNLDQKYMAELVPSGFPRSRATHSQNPPRRLRIVSLPLLSHLVLRAAATTPTTRCMTRSTSRKPRLWRTTQRAAI